MSEHKILMHTALLLQLTNMIKKSECKEIDRAQRLLDKALSLDHDFAYAWRLKYSVYYRKVWLCGGPNHYYEQALYAASKADEISPGQYTALLTGQVEILTETNRAEQGFDLIKSKLNDDVNILNSAVYIYRYAGFFNYANELMDEILRRAPLNYLGKPVMHSPNVLLYQNRYDEYLSQLSNSGFLYHDYYRAFAKYLNNDIEQAKAILKKAVSVPSENIYFDYSAALLAVLEKDFNKVKAVIEKIGAQRRSIGNQDGEKTYKEAQLLALAGFEKEALALLNKTVEQGFFGVSIY